MEYMKYFTGDAHLQQQKMNYFPGLGTQTDTAAVAAAAAGLQNLAALAAMTAQSSALTSAAASVQPQPPSHSAQLSNAAALLCKYSNAIAMVFKYYYRYYYYN